MVNKDVVSTRHEPEPRVRQSVQQLQAFVYH